ncbi:hypothetical protein C5D35_09955 [Rathayibacter toxicus]|nr:hypothetical protein C5D35_09955 [Rathayibacter toxicus]
MGWRWGILGGSGIVYVVVSVVGSRIDVRQIATTRVEENLDVTTDFLMLFGSACLAFLFVCEQAKCALFRAAMAFMKIFLRSIWFFVRVPAITS